MGSKRKIVVLGAGESGTGSAVLALKKGYEVFVSDGGTIAENYRKELRELGIAFEEGAHTASRVLEAGEVIKSPGIGETAPVVRLLRENRIPVIAEIEFASRYTDARMIGITGSNGKTTTTLLTHHILRNAGLKVGLAGNVGQSFARQVAETECEYYVLELSSFQLDDMYRFRAHIAVLTNITPDHLDRYEYQFENYINSKFRILQNQREDDSFIYCLDDEGIRRGLASRKPAAKLYPFSIKEAVAQGACLDGNELTVKTEHNSFNMTIAELALQGKHNLYNSMAASIAAKVLDLRNEVVRESLGDFKNLEHRLERVGKIQGIEFINDSKATNVNATWYALESMTTPVVWIAGGVDKGNDYSMLKGLVREKVKAIVCLGKDSRKIHDAFEEDTEIIVNTLAAGEAVKVAYHLAAKGDTVLLSPACSSFDLFKNYEDRGNQFKEAIKQL